MAIQAQQQFGEVKKTRSEAERVADRAEFDLGERLAAFAVGAGAAGLLALAGESTWAYARSRFNLGQEDYLVG